MALSDDQLKAFGKITVNFAYLEFLVGIFMGGLLGPDMSAGYIVASQLSFGRTLVVIESLMRSKCTDKALVEECCAHLKTMGAAEQERNKITHSIWVIRDDGSNPGLTRLKIAARAKKGLVHQTEDFTTDQLNVLADRMKNIAKDFTMFLGKCVLNGLIEAKSAG